MVKGPSVPSARGIVRLDDRTLILAIDVLVTRVDALSAYFDRRWFEGLRAPRDRDQGAV